MARWRTSRTPNTSGGPPRHGADAPLRTAPGSEGLENGDDPICGDRLAFGYIETPHHAVPWRGDLVLHLHRLQDEEGLPSLHAVTGSDHHPDDAARHRRAHVDGGPADCRRGRSLGSVFCHLRDGYRVAAIVDDHVAALEPDPMRFGPDADGDPVRRRFGSGTVFSSIDADRDPLGIPSEFDVARLTLDDEPEPHGHLPRAVVDGRRAPSRTVGGAPPSTS